jgi:hypothetical protein
VYFGQQAFVIYVFGKHFLPICSLSFHSFAVENFLILMKSSLPILSFIDVPSVLYLKRNCETQSNKIFLLSSTFIVLHFIFRFVIHFELMLVKGVLYLNSVPPFLPFLYPSSSSSSTLFFLLFLLLLLPSPPLPSSSSLSPSPPLFFFFHPLLLLPLSLLLT